MSDKTTKRKERAAKRKEAMAICRDWLKEVKEDLDENVVEALTTIIGSGKKERTARVPQYMEVINLIADKGKVSEDDIWNTFKLGRTDMRAIVRKYIKKAIEGQDIVWIVFDEDDNYSVLAVSADVPSNWEGPLPTTTKEVVKDEVIEDDEDEDDLAL